MTRTTRSTRRTVVSGVCSSRSHTRLPTRRTTRADSPRSFTGASATSAPPPRGVAAMESALDASRLGGAPRATALAALSGLASRGVDALGADSPSDSGTSRRAFLPFAIRTDGCSSAWRRSRYAVARATTDGSHKEENTKTEIAKTRAGGAETLARTIAAELAETRAAPAGGLGAGLGDGARASATLDGVVAAVTGDPSAPRGRVMDARARNKKTSISISNKRNGIRRSGNETREAASRSPTR